MHSQTISLGFILDLTAAADFECSGGRFTNISLDRDGNQSIIKYNMDGSFSMKKSDVPEGLIARIIVANKRNTLTNLLPALAETVKLMNRTQRDNVDEIDFKLKFTSITVENLQGIFLLHAEQLSLHVISRLVSMDRLKFRELKGKTKKWVKNDDYCIVYFPNEGRDINITSSTPTYNRFVSWFGKTWGEKQKSINSAVVSAVGLSFGWHGLLTEEGTVAIGDNYTDDNKWIIYTSSIVKCKPIAEWKMTPIEVNLMLAYSVFNELKAGPKGDFVKKMYGALMAAGYTVDTERFFSLCGRIAHILAKNSGNGGVVSEQFMSKLAWMKDNSTHLFTARSETSIGVVTDVTKIKSAMVEWKNSNKRE